MRLINADALIEAIRKTLGIKSMTKSLLLPAERTIIDQIDSAPTVAKDINVPTKPTIVTNSRGWTYLCGACEAEMVTIRDTVSANYARKNIRYCQRCGRPVKWE